MIISMIDIPLQTKACEALSKEMGNAEIVQYSPDLDLSKMKGNALAIVDLRADGDFQTLNNPEKLTDFLTKCHLPKTVKNIHLLISDVTSKMRVLTYAAKLVKTLKAKGYDVVVNYLHVKDHNDPITLLCSPQPPDQDWQIFGIKQANVKKANTLIDECHDDFERDIYKELCAYPNKILLWKGRNPLSSLAPMEEKSITSFVTKPSSGGIN